MPLHWDLQAPELMFRRIAILLQRDVLDQSVVACGCGGGDAVTSVLPAVIARAWSGLVLDAEALNAIACDASLQAQLSHRSECGAFTVLAPNPLEEAHLLGSNTVEVMRDRLRASRTLAEHFGAAWRLRCGPWCEAEQAQAS
jgi:NAD(P)H-hydrate repair Nnr-like enzyme with NAD(P)H-hydrate dehydratase domain